MVLVGVSVVLPVSEEDRVPDSVIGSEAVPL